MNSQKVPPIPADQPVWVGLKETAGFGKADDVIMPVFSSGQWADQAPDTYEALGNADCMYLAGGGILGHPDGPAAGVAHLKQGWEAAMAHIPFDEYAENHPELRTALDYYERR